MPREDNNTYAMVAFLCGIMVTVAAMILAIFIALQRPTIVVVGSTAQPAAAPIPTSSTTQPTGAAPATMPSEITATRVPAVPALTNPYDPAWDRIPAADIPLLPQAMAMPMLDRTTVPSLSVQTLHDNNRITFRLSWPAPQPSANVDTGRFTDAVALQLAQDPTTPFMMGTPGKPVRIIHWKALWQKDLDEGYQDVQNLHPNFWDDFYWFAEGKFPFPLADSFKNPVSRQWLIAYSANNPIADFQRKQPVEEIVAEGVGSITHLSDTPATARGSWKSGRWTVVIDRPYSTDDPLSNSLKPGQTDVVAFAVWDGSADNVGGRKHYCTWLPLKVQP